MASITTIMDEKNHHPTQIESQLLMEFDSTNSNLTVRTFQSGIVLKSHPSIPYIPSDKPVPQHDIEPAIRLIILPY